MTKTTKTTTLISECVFVLVILSGFLVSTAHSQQLNLYEDDACHSHGGVAGVCRRGSQCPQAFQQIQGVRRQDPVICSFSGASSDGVIVCCKVLGTTPRPAVIRNTARPVTRNTARSVLTKEPRGPVILKTTPRPGVLNLNTTVKPVLKTTPKPVVAVKKANETVGLGNRILAGEKARKACDDMANEIQFLPTPLIYGGISTAEGEFPHMALLGYRGRSGTAPLTWNCGGSLISNLYVLTAAHCLRTKNQGLPVLVRLGEFDLEEDTDHAVDFRVAEIVVHPDYNSRAWYNDIGLIRLDQPAKFSEYIHPACLYTKPDEPPNGLIITGWGVTTSDGDRKSSVLLKGNHTMSPVPGSTCIKSYNGAGLRIAQGIQPGMFCALAEQGNVDTCRGDSGGPIQVAVETSPATVYLVVGVTSAGPSLCGGRTPAIYARVYHYLSWIEDIVWK